MEPWLAFVLGIGVGGVVGVLVTAWTVAGSAGDAYRRGHKDGQRDGYLNLHRELGSYDN